MTDNFKSGIKIMQNSEFIMLKLWFCDSAFLYLYLTNREKKCTIDVMLCKK